MVTLADDRGLTRLNTTAPTSLAEKIRSASVAGDQRIVTALFADVVGSTSLAERLDAEEWAEIMKRAAGNAGCLPARR